MTVKHVKTVKKTISTSVQCPKYQFAGWNTQQTCGYNAMLAQLNCLNKINLKYIVGSLSDPLSVVYFNQLSGACSTWKLVEPIFLAIFNLFCWFCDFVIISDLTIKINKKTSENEQKIFFFIYLENCCIVYRKLPFSLYIS